MTTPIFITELDLRTPATPPISGKPTRRRHNSAVASACDQCHRCKLRCSGEKPNCQRCRDNGSACTYSAGSLLGKQRRNKTRTASRRRGVSGVWSNPWIVTYPCVPILNMHQHRSHRHCHLHRCFGNRTKRQPNGKAQY
jgi:hypothetical protein